MFTGIIQSTGIIENINHKKSLLIYLRKSGDSINGYFIESKIISIDFLSGAQTSAFL